MRCLIIALIIIAVTLPATGLLLWIASAILSDMADAAQGSDDEQYR